MSSYINSIIKNVKEFYSEINGSTLTGAIDVVVVEQEDGTFKSSPFHVRFGKMGVLKAKEKIVHIEINGLPMDINMKLDDTGVAFFVEEIEEGDYDEDWLADLATSPLPDKELDWGGRRSGVFQPAELFLPESHAAVLEEDEVLATVLPPTTTQEDIEEEDEEEEEDESPENSRVEEVAGFPKLNKKKRKRRNQLRTSRRGSRGNNSQKENETEAESEFVGDDMFSMDDVQPSAMEETMELPIPMHGQKTPSRHLSNSSSKDNQESRDPTIALLEPLQAVFVTEALSSEGLLTTSADFQLYPGPGQPEEVDSLAPNLETALATEQPDTTTVWRWGEPMMEVQAMQEAPVEVVKQEPETGKSEEEVKSSSWLGMFRGSRSSQSPEETGGVYLDDIVNDPEKRAFYLQPSLQVCVGPSDPLDLTHIPRAGLDQPLDDDCESGTGPSLPMSPQSLIVSPSGHPLAPGSTDDLVSLVSRHLPDLAASLCGGLTDRSITPAQFNSGLLTYQQFLQKIKEASPILEDPALVMRLHEKYVSWSTASPILLSLMFFKKPMPADVIEDILKDGLPVNLNLSAEEATLQKESTRKGTSWFRWFGSSSEQPSQEDEVKTELLPADIKTEIVDESELVLQIPGTPRKRLETETTCSDSGEKRRWKKTLRLTSEQLASLNLQKGSNEVDFSVTTRIQGTTECRCHIYLWHHTDKIVISDIDGTITKSDVLGQFLPMVGRDWAQSGVADLFSKIRANGYHIMYLSARAIGQASMTKDYLELLRQDEVCLPDGPVFLNPESLIHAFKREVIDKNPEEFKIRCLKDIETLFGGKNPFFAGYGNKPNDAYAYRSLGIPVSRIFTINPAGELKHELTHNFQTSYESQSLEVDYYFPCLTTVQQIRDIMAANTRKQSIYFDVLDFVPQQTHRKLQGDHENLSDTEDSAASKPFRARSGTDISDMLSSAKHRKNLRSGLQRSRGARRGALVPAEQILNIKEPMSRCPSLDMEGEVGLEVWLENGGDVVKDLLDLN